MALMDGSLLFLFCAAAAVVSFTILFPVLAALVAPLITRRSTTALSDAEWDLTVIIPAYKEAETLPLTLTSINLAIAELMRVHPGARVSVTVGLDGADPATKAACSGYSVSITEFPENVGKWKVLRALAPATTARWVALTDAGTLWPRNLLTALWPEITGNRYAGLAPGYVQPSASWPERAHWAVERTLKLLENLAGGPVSVHGAAVFYRSDVAREAFRQLGSGPWFNDDVVLPLMVRAFGHRIRYYGATAAVSDAGISHSHREGARRARMVEGNLQWIGSLWWNVARRNPAVAMLAARRGWRPFWIYVAVVPFIAAVSVAPWSLALLMVCLCGALVLHPRIQGAALASLRAPQRVFARDGRGVSWS
jgi:hypothetical protein